MIHWTNAGLMLAQRHRRRFKIALIIGKCLDWHVYVNPISVLPCSAQHTKPWKNVVHCNVAKWLILCFFEQNAIILYHFILATLLQRKCLAIQVLTKTSNVMEYISEKPFFVHFMAYYLLYNNRCSGMEVSPERKRDWEVTLERKRDWEVKVRCRW